MDGRWIIRQGSTAPDFRYTDEAGNPVRDRSALDRFAALHIPPGWHDVHIAPGPSSMIQAWGLDARGRKQYRYNELAVQTREARKYFRVRRLARDLPRIRAALQREITEGDSDRRRVAAAAVRLISKGFFRIGNERYVRENNTYGLVTLHKEHVRVERDVIAFAYRGKESKEQRHVVVDDALARFVERLLETPGPRLFRYRATRGEWRDLTAPEVNAYIQALTGMRYTAKDFRTWGGTVRTATVLAELGAPASEREAKRNVAMAARFVAAELGNTPAILRASYVHPIVIARYVDDGETIVLPSGSEWRSASSGYYPEEGALIRFLSRHFRTDVDSSAPRCRWQRDRQLLAAICTASPNDLRGI